ncbi:hypothetical protein RV11_GL003514 [Enterococcus phoeniculicola]|uniref:Pectinesterase catalytic domain-containing protein n=1 Tax=Enterococcus phoeniculicola ATCC BAA-412 TaxID=1158610 RepID=R3WJF6_9ENTE|nr:hypothetical protein [Enterococcus phoeniculicola]EOL41990.1 hypothetical protein UC3_02338 [Enterococcus phoeniculicola ATCC BAA-412]EOT79731.1 hypothetical protein I589_01243 [Enterococcus phoeniculicola ATCC BAA-412]OJG71793.1 hypothetical protein RV11_GL003514 [Enterococcus phoeniculicola]
MLPKWTSNRIDLEFKKLIDKIVDRVNGLLVEAEKRDNATNKRIDNLVLQSGGTSPNEVIDARVNSLGQTFDTLHARLLAGDNLTANEIVELTKNYENQKEELQQLQHTMQGLFGGTSQVIDIFISSKIGNDAIADGTETKPFKTIQSAINSLPMISSNTYYLWVEPGSYLEDVNIDSIQASRIYIYATNYTTTTGKSDETGCFVRSFTFMNVISYIQVNGFTFVDTKNTEDHSIFCDISRYVSVQNCRFLENTKGNSKFSSIYTSGGTIVSIGSGTVLSNQYTSVYIQYGSQALLGSTKGSANTIGYVADGGTVRIGSSASMTATTLKQEKNGGQVLG